MPLQHKPIDAIDAADLQALADNQVAEAKVIEYKESLPGNPDAARKDFLADVSSFANAAGGHLIYGIKEQSGVPIDIPGLKNINADAEILRLENMIRDSIDPRIPGVAMRAIEVESSGVVILLRIPRSWALPHMITFQAYSRFYSRNSAGKYPLDVRELRAAFALSETTAERIRNFRAERLSQIVAGETPRALEEGAKIVLHIVSFGAFDPAGRVDLSLLDQTKLGPMNHSGWRHRYNFDGLLTFTFNKPELAYSYLQVFRNGSIEAVDASMLSLWKGQRNIPSSDFERELMDSLARFLLVEKGLGVEPPLFVMLSLLGVSGYTMGVNRSLLFREDANPIDRDALLIPEVVVETLDCDPAEVMHPIFDAVWNAAGWPRSMSYNDAGEWVGQR